MAPVATSLITSDSKSITSIMTVLEHLSGEVDAGSQKKMR